MGSSRKVHKVGCDNAPVLPDAVDYRLASNGRILALYRCELGHGLTEIAPPQLPADLDGPRRFEYVTCAAVGYAWASSQGNIRRAEMIRRLELELPGKSNSPLHIARLVGLSESEVNGILKHQRPRTLQGIYREGVQAIREWSGGK